MTDLEKQPFGEALLALGAAFNREVDKPLAAAFWMACSDLELKRVLTAVRSLIRQGGKYMPTPSELRQKAGAATVPYHVEYRPKAFTPKEEWLSLPAMQEPKEGGK